MYSVPLENSTHSRAQIKVSPAVRLRFLVARSKVYSIFKRFLLSFSYIFLDDLRISNSLFASLQHQV